jgi:hypothetical protein
VGAAAVDIFIDDNERLVTISTGANTVLEIAIRRMAEAEALQQLRQSVQAVISGGLTEELFIKNGRVRFSKSTLVSGVDRTTGWHIGSAAAPPTMSQDGVVRYLPWADALVFDADVSVMR